MELLKKSKVLPAEFIDNRIIAKPVTKDGVQLNFLTDTGGGLVMTPEGVIKTNANIYREIMDGTEVKLAELPEFEEGNWIPPLVVNGKSGKMRVIEEANVFEAPLLEKYDGLLGQAWFGYRFWTFDYLNKQMIYHEELDHTLMYQNHKVNLSFKEDGQGNRINHFPRIQATVDNEQLDFLFDTGATVKLSEYGYNQLNDQGGKQRGTCFITENKFNRWRERHPDWRIIENAEQVTNFPMIEVPEINVAGYTVGPVWFTYRVNSSFHWYMAQMMDKPVEGALGGSLFQYFKITVDYRKGIAYFER